MRRLSKAVFSKGIPVPVVSILCSLLVLLASALAAQSESMRVWPAKAPDEPAWILEKKAKAATGSDGVIRIPYVDTPELHHFPTPPT